MLNVYLAWALEKMTASHNVHTGQMSPPEEGCGTQHVFKWSLARVTAGAGFGVETFYHCGNDTLETIRSGACSHCR